jgi:serine phosphatase RsbU (regulator of sigma subunit)
LKDITSFTGTRGWRCILLSFLMLVLAIITVQLLPGETNSSNILMGWLTPCLLIASWVLAIRFLLFDTWGKWLWVVLLAIGAVTSSTLDDGGIAFGVLTTLIFLSFRRYRPWRHVPDRRRALGFGIGLVALGLGIWGWGALSAAEGTGLAGHVIDVGMWALLSIIGFWVYSLFHLVMNMRLHFMRLRSKLGVSAFLIGFIPMALIIILAIAALWFGLGGARAQRGLSTLESWRTMTSRGYNFSGAMFDTTFAWSISDSSLLDIPFEDLSETEVVEVKPPSSITELVRTWKLQSKETHAVGGTVAPDSTGWFIADSKLWLMHWRGLDGPDVSVQGWLLGQAALSRLSENLHAGVRISSSGFSSDNGQIVFGSSSDKGDGIFSGVQYYFRDPGNTQGIWNKFFYFGGGLLNVTASSNKEWFDYPLILQVRVSYKDLLDDFVSGRGDLNLGVVIGLAALAGLFLIIEIFALFFSVRISEGIVSAVHALHKRTKTLAAGDLDSWVDIPNEDEFGDLAQSFNEMAAAVKVGQEAALANQRLTQEMDTARSIQERLLPAGEPQSSGFQITGASIPSREVGGDYFDFLIIDDHHVGVAIGDVSGKGMPAALLMANLQASLQGQVIHPSSVSEVVSRVNDLVVRSTDPHMFATFFYGLIDTSEGTFTSTNAGHNPPMVLRNSGEVDLLTKGGLLLGMLDEQPYKQETIQLEPGEVVVLYTDGITEAVGPGVEEDDPEAMFGEDALLEVLKSNGHLPAVGIKEAILDAVKEHTTGMQQSDDITLVVVRRQD